MNDVVAENMKSRKDSGRIGQGWFVVILCCLLVLPQASVLASTAEVSLMTQGWSLDLTDGSDFRQTVLAATFDMPQANGRKFGLYGYIPFAWSSDDAAEATLSGAGDTQLRANWRNATSKWLLTVGVDVPTGKTGLTTEEYIVATRILASRALDFQFKRPGEGLDFMVSVARAHPIGRNTVLGFALAGFIKGDYDVTTDQAGSLLRTSPGSRLHASVSFLAREHDQDPDWDLQVNLGLQMASDSELSEGSEDFVVGEGLQGKLDVNYSRRLRSEDRLRAFLFLLSRGTNQVEGRDLMAVDILGIGTRWLNEFGVQYSRPVSQIGVVGVGVAHTMYQLEAFGDVNSRVTSFELKADRQFTPRISAVLEFRYGFGNTPWSMPGQLNTWERRDLSGLSLGMRGRYNW